MCRAAERNRLLASLPSELLADLQRDLQNVQLGAGQVLAVPGEPLCDVYFPREAVLSLLVPMQDGTAIEGATIGNEGLIGLQVFLGDGTATEEIFVQVPGQAARLSAAAFRRAVRGSLLLTTVLGQYTLALMNQLARTAACNLLHMVDQRCARLLLMTQDRVGEDMFPLTQEAIANTLSVRRASVTEAAVQLQRRGLIAYRLGQITIFDRAGLEAVACEDYRLCKGAYDVLYAQEGGRKPSGCH